MSEASDLIERLEKETGCRIDSNGHDNMAMNGLLGAMARALGKNPHRPEDDVIAGTVIRHQMSPDAIAQARSDDMMAEMIGNGIHPDILKDIVG